MKNRLKQLREERHLSQKTNLIKNQRMWGCC
nr:MAG TPA: hypothetical protein [Caudoviricetes sp.]